MTSDTISGTISSTISGPMPATVAEAAAAFARRALSPVELARALLDRIGRLDPALHAFLRVLPEHALEQARLAEGRMMAGLRLGPLDGVPIAHKDVFDTAGIETTGNSRRFLGRVPDANAALVDNLGRAGAVTLGKLACYEGAFAGPSFDLPWPPPRNPWDLDRSTSGSSSGSAVAVAAGLVLGATGSDTGGSLRDPAGVCGVAGFKPSLGLVSPEGMGPFASSLDTPGPMARTAFDCALLLGGMLDHPRDFTEAARAGGRGMRIGLVPAWTEQMPVSDGVRRAVSTAADAFRAMGAHVVELDLPPLRAFEACGWTIAMAELHEVHRSVLDEDGGAGYGAMLRAGLAVGARVPAHRYIAALRRRAELIVEMKAAMSDVELLLLPAQDAEAAPVAELGGKLPFEKPTFTMPFDVTGQPAIVIPAVAGEKGLPVGVQIVAALHREDALLRGACALEDVLGAHGRRPDLGDCPGG